MISEHMAASAPTPAGFNLYDLLTRVTPGLFFLTIVAVTCIQWDFLISATDSSFFTVIALFAGFLAGEIIDSVRMWLFAAPKPFRVLLYREQESEEQESKEKESEKRKFGDWWSDLRVRVHNHHFLVGQMTYQFSSAGDEFWPRFKRYLKTNDDLKDSNEIYLRLAADLDPKITALTRRYQTTTVFIQNMRVATPFAIICALLSLTVETGVSDSVKLLFWLF